MLIEKGKRMLLLRFSNYKKYDFIECHKDLIEKNGFVWMIKMGKPLPKPNLDSVVNDGGTLILKAPKSCGGNLYIAKILECYNGIPSEEMTFPAYYHVMEKDDNIWMLGYSLDGSWFKITDLSILSNEDASRIRLISNGKLAVDVLDSTRTSVMYVTV